MSVFYNENDPSAAAWIRELIADGQIAPGVVDERSIVDIEPHEIRSFTQCHFFAGISGWSLALRLVGWSDDRSVWTASLPCQPFSNAGQQKGAGDDRHLWPVFARLVRECRPDSIFGEQVARAIGFNWLDGVSADLEAAGYAVGPGVLGAHSVGAPHRRQRLYWVAYAENADGRARECAEEAGTGSHGERWGRSGERGVAGSVADSNGGDASAEREQRGREQRFEPEDDNIVPLADSEHDDGRPDEPWRGSQGRTVDGRAGGLADTLREGRQEKSLGLLGAGNKGNWSYYDIIGCRDGKARRIERATFPLVARIPGGMVPSGDPSVEEVQATAEARTMRLRGYGNSIVPELAAQFILACEDARDSLR